MHTWCFPIIIAKQPEIFPPTALISFRRGGADWWLEGITKEENELDLVMFLQLFCVCVKPYFKYQNICWHIWNDQKTKVDKWEVVRTWSFVAAPQCVVGSAKAPRPAHTAHPLPCGGECLTAQSVRSACSARADMFAHSLPFIHSRWHPVHESVFLNTNQFYTL